MSKLKITIKENECIVDTKKNIFIVKSIDDSTIMCMNILKNKNKYFSQSVEFIKTKHWFKRMVKFCKSINYDEVKFKYSLDKAIDEYKKTCLTHRIDNFNDNINELNDNINELNDKINILTELIVIDDEQSKSCSIDLDIDDYDEDSDEIDSYNLLPNDEDADDDNKINSDNCLYIRITDEDGEKILEMWKDMTARQISEQFPMYSISQISRYCRKYSTFRKR